LQSVERRTQKFRSSGVQEFRSSGVQEFRRILTLLTVNKR
jgi:hypothetical protein